MTATGTKPKDVNCELLYDVIYGARMGASACQTLMTKTQDQQLLGSLEAQLEQYNAVKTDAENELRARGEEIPTSILGEAGLKLGVHMNTLADSSPSHIAEMLIEGSTMGIVDATRAKNRYSSADPKIAGMAQHLIDIERGNIDNMEKRLS